MARLIRLLDCNLVYMGPNIEEPEEQLLDRIFDLPNATGMVTSDTETVSTQDHTILGIGIAFSANEALYCPVQPVQCEWLPDFVELLASEMVKVYHNANFDIDALRKLAFEEELPPPDLDNVEDTALMARVSAMPVGLETIASDLLGYDAFSIQDLLNDARRRLGKKTVNMTKVPWLEAARKCLNDVLNTWEAYEYLTPLSIALPQVWDCYQADMTTWTGLKKVELEGLLLDQDVLNQHFNRLSRIETEIREEFELGYGINPGSPSQVGMYFANKGYVLPMTKSRKKLRSDEEVLLSLNDPEADRILEYRSISKLLGTYIKPWMGLKRAYTHFRLDLSTGRLGSYDKNLQNIPGEVRNVFSPDSGVFTWADMSQVEMRVFAYMTKEPKMLKVYAEGGDIHKDTTEKVILPYYPHLDYVEARKKAKIFNFAMIYYGTAKTLAARCGLPIDVATSARRDWLDIYTVGRDWMNYMYNNRFPYVEDIYGRRMKIPTDEEIWAVAKSAYKFRAMQAHVRRTQVNFPIQASAASLNKRGMNMQFEWGMPLRLQVHDEYLWDGDVEVPEELHHIHPELETPFEKAQGPKWHK